MTTEQHDATRAAADRVVKLEEEAESSGFASVEGTELERARAALHQWVDAMTGVVISPGLGRVTVIHGNGTRSTISSPDLPFRMSARVR